MRSFLISKKIRLQTWLPLTLFSLFVASPALTHGPSHSYLESFEVSQEAPAAPIDYESVIKRLNLKLQEPLNFSEYKKLLVVSRELANSGADGAEALFWRIASATHADTIDLVEFKREEAIKQVAEFIKDSENKERAKKRFLEFARMYKNEASHEALEGMIMLLRNGYDFSSNEILEIVKHEKRDPIYSPNGLPSRSTRLVGTILVDRVLLAKAGAQDDFWDFMDTFVDDVRSFSQEIKTLSSRRFKGELNEDQFYKALSRSYRWPKKWTFEYIESVAESMSEAGRSIDSQKIWNDVLRWHVPEEVDASNFKKLVPMPNRDL